MFAPAAVSPEPDTEWKPDYTQLIGLESAQPGRCRAHRVSGAALSGPPAQSRPRSPSCYCLTARHVASSRCGGEEGGGGGRPKGSILEELGRLEK